MISVLDRRGDSPPSKRRRRSNGYDRVSAISFCASFAPDSRACSLIGDDWVLLSALGRNGGQLAEWSRLHGWRPVGQPQSPPAHVVPTAQLKADLAVGAEVDEAERLVEADALLIG